MELCDESIVKKLGVTSYSPTEMYCKTIGFVLSYS